MQTVGRVPVRFDRPPVIEVACGISFNLPKALKSAHVGLYWGRRLPDFPRCEDAPPISMVVEGKGPVESTEFNIQVESAALPPLRRAWLIDSTGTQLVQLQEDRFLFNWKSTEKDSSYPSYVHVAETFRKEWASFKAFLETEALGTPTVIQLELTYFNFWPGTAKWLKDFQRDESTDRFLPPPAALNWKTSFDLPEAQGRLHIGAGNARHSVTQEMGIRLDLTARGLPRDTSDTGCDRWFDLAHDWITHGFADITTSDAHRAWGRTA